MLVKETVPSRGRNVSRIKCQPLLPRYEDALLPLAVLLSQRCETEPPEELSNIHKLLQLPNWKHMCPE